MKQRVLIIQEWYLESDGSSVPLKGYLNDNKEIEYKILARNVGIYDLNIKEVSCYEEVKKELANNRYDVIHYFRLMKYELFRWTVKAIKELKLGVKIVITVNQRPSFVGTLLSPQEIRNSDYIVFIDHTAYHDSLLSFIPDSRKRCIFYCASGMRKYDRYYETRKKHHAYGRKVIFGRGSTLNKCPSDMIENFDKIKYDDKEFRIIGVPQNSWVVEQAKNYENVYCLPKLSLNDWYEELMKFDVFLYQIPKDSHSSLDGTLGAAMLMGIPVVYSGAEAPKERIVHGVSGFIAETSEEIVEWCTKLANDIELRKKIGDAGRIGNQKMFNWRSTVESYNELYSSKKNHSRIRVPFKYSFYFYKTSWRDYFSEELNDMRSWKIYSIYKKLKQVINV